MSQPENLGQCLTAGLPWQDGPEMVVKEVLPGDSVHSLLSILDVITVSLPTPRSSVSQTDTKMLPAPVPDGMSPLGVFCPTVSVGTHLVTTCYLCSGCYIRFGIGLLTLRPCPLPPMVLPAV